VEKRKRCGKGTGIRPAQGGCRCFSLDSTFLPEGTYPTLLRGECGVELLSVLPRHRDPPSSPERLPGCTWRADAASLCKEREWERGERGRERERERRGGGEVWGGRGTRRRVLSGGDAREEATRVRWRGRGSSTRCTTSTSGASRGGGRRVRAQVPFPALPHSGFFFFFFFFFTLVTGPRRSLSLNLSVTRVYAPQIQARLGTTAHFCRVVVLTSRAILNLMREVAGIHQLWGGTEPGLTRLAIPDRLVQRR